MIATATWLPGIGYVGEEAACRTEGHIYVLEWLGDDSSDGVLVKVGMTTQPDTRVETLRRQPGFTLNRVWVSGPHVNQRGTERDLLGWCKTQLGQPFDCWGDYFQGLAWDDIVAHAESMTYRRHCANVPHFDAYDA